MSSNEIAIKIEGLGKRYEIYDQPGDRLKQFLFPRLRSLFRLSPKQYFREFWALRDISFEVKRGETVGIIGRNGSGKSTLLQIICGTLTPTTGSVQTNGRIAALLELGSGFNPEFTGRENVYLNASVLGLTKEETDARFDDIVAFADIGDFIDQPTKTYSSGMTVRLAFAVIAHVDADILVIDEALAVGDAFFTQKCMRFLRGFMKTGSVIFVSHDTASIQSLCTSAAWIESGSMKKIGSPKKISELYLECFFGNQNQLDKVEIHPQSDLRIKKSDQIEIIDQRSKFINGSNLRNDLQVFFFNEDNCDGFGDKGALIKHAGLYEGARTLSWVVGGEKVRLEILAEIMRPLKSIIIGFYIKNKLGQPIFGDNTFISYADNPVNVHAGQKIQASFVFSMPILPIGDYSIAVAIASGTQEEHIHHHWLHDALIIKSVASSAVTGLVGLPMEQILLSAID
jgi:lipopolysaccharide transport system ATP-binding protein